MGEIYLARNIRHLRKRERLSQKDLAMEIGVPRSTLNNWERGTSEPKLEDILLIAAFFQIRVEDIIGTKVEYLRNEDYSSGIRVLAVTLSEKGSTNVELVDSKAEAGYLDSFQDPEYIRDLPRFSFPNLPHGNYRGFEIAGESMLPIEPGAIVICRYIEKMEGIKDGETYIIASSDGLVYKRVYKDNQRNVLLLVSDNSLFRPYEIAYDEVKEIWRYYAHLSFNSGKEIVDNMVDEKLKELNEKVDRIYSYITTKGERKERESGNGEPTSTEEKK